MTDSLFIFNERSGSYNPALVAEIEQLFAQGDWPLARVCDIGEGALPDAAEAKAQNLGLIVVLSGDGTLAAVAESLAGWEGTLLILPGGTMNLLSRTLHGDRTAQDIVRAYLDGQGSILRPPVILAGEITAYTGMIVGPTAAWGNVREALRNFDLTALADKVPAALSATFDSPGVTLEGEEQDYPAIFVEPSLAGLRAYGVLATGAGDLFKHGWAWLAGDFRDGPSEPLGTAAHFKMCSDGDTLDLLVDGEKADTKSPLEMKLGRAGVHFFAAQGEKGWR